MTKVYRNFINSEIGIVEITATDKGIRTIEFYDSLPDFEINTNRHIEKAMKQLDMYFNGKLKKFDLELDWVGTNFMEKVWKYLLTIPYGKTVTYKDIAESLGDVNAVRAVGMANGKNNIAIVVPCHRVIGVNKKLTGYAYGLWRKEWLLKHEGVKFEEKKEQIELF